MDPLFPVAPENWAELEDEQLDAFIAESEQVFEAIRSDSASFVTEERTTSDLVAEMQVAADALSQARGELSSRGSDEADENEDEEPDTASVEALAAEALAAAEGEKKPGETVPGEPAPDDEPAADDKPDPADEAKDDGDAEGDTVKNVNVQAAANPQPTTPVKAQLPRPARSRTSIPEPERPKVALTASAPNLGPAVGQQIDRLELAEMMMKKRRDFGRIAEGTKGEQIPLAMMDWRDTYGEERTLDSNEVSNQEKIARALDVDVIQAELERRKSLGLTASGGLCAPVTPYYDLAMISVADRPVRAGLPSFNAVRGGIRAARPAALTSITTAISTVSAAEDGLGGTFATKTCQVVACPPFFEQDVQAIVHCLQFGNLPSRTFPELLAQWTDLVLAAHARTAESLLLSEIAATSTATTVGNTTGLGATATLPVQVIEAAAAMRSRHRMARDAVLRVMLPQWVLDLLVSDMYRSQFDRFDMGPEDFVRILRAANVEPSFYMDGSATGGQVFGNQAAGALLTFPTYVEWFIFPEGSWLYLDGGTLELGLVRDSVLNETNDFQIFGETFENVAFIGVESIKVRSAVCNSGAVTAPNDVNCPVT